jgi:ABC-type glycerol-3-phosphate transport system substrate-binding protein
MLDMSVRRFAMLAATTALLGAAGGVAQAAPASVAATATAQSVNPQSTSTKPLDFTVHADGSPLAGAQMLKWDYAAKGRWGVTLNLQQPDTRQTTLNDIQAGAYYKITPALRVGGAFALGDQQPIPGPKPNSPDTSQPRVQLETKFKF